MASRRKNIPTNFLKGYKVVIKHHVIQRYIERTGVSELEAKETLELKFRNSRLSQVKPDGSEIRKEVERKMDKRLTFVAKKYGTTFVVITCYLQGRADDWWKNDGLVKNNVKWWIT